MCDDSSAVVAVGSECLPSSQPLELEQLLANNSGDWLLFNVNVKSSKSSKIWRSTRSMSADNCWIDDVCTTSGDLISVGGDRPLRLETDTSGSIKANCIRAQGLSSPPPATSIDVFARLPNLPVWGRDDVESGSLASRCSSPSIMWLNSAMRLVVHTWMACGL